MYLKLQSQEFCKTFLYSVVPALLVILLELVVVLNLPDLLVHPVIVQALACTQRRFPWVIARVEQDDADAELGQFHSHSCAQAAKSRLKNGIFLFWK